MSFLPEGIPLWMWILSQIVAIPAMFFIAKAFRYGDADKDKARLFLVFHSLTFAVSVALLANWIMVPIFLIAALRDLIFNWREKRYPDSRVLSIAIFAIFMAVSLASSLATMTWWFDWLLMGSALFVIYATWVKGMTIMFWGRFAISVLAIVNHWVFANYLTAVTTIIMIIIITIGFWSKKSSLDRSPNVRDKTIARIHRGYKTSKWTGGLNKLGLIYIALKVPFGEIIKKGMNSWEVTSNVYKYSIQDNPEYLTLWHANDYINAPYILRAHKEKEILHSIVGNELCNLLGSGNAYVESQIEDGLNVGIMLDICPEALIEAEKAFPEAEIRQMDILEFVKEKHEGWNISVGCLGNYFSLPTIAEAVMTAIENGASGFVFDVLSPNILNQSIVPMAKDMEPAFCYKVTKWLGWRMHFGSWEDAPEGWLRFYTPTDVKKTFAGNELKIELDFALFDMGAFCIIRKKQ